MEKAELLRAIEVPKGFTDVLYLTNQGQMPSEIKRLLRQRKLSSRILPIDKYPEVRSRLGMIGTVVIDVQDSDAIVVTIAVLYDGMFKRITCECC